MNQSWPDLFIGIPFVDKGRSLQGLDCWGLVCLVQKMVFDTEVPDYGDRYEHAEDGNGISSAVKDQKKNGPWKKIEKGAEKEGDVVFFLICGEPFHAGIVLGGGKMLHTQDGVGVIVDDYRGKRYGGRIEGFYRPAARA